MVRSRENVVHKRHVRTTSGAIRGLDTAHGVLGPARAITDAQRLANKVQYKIRRRVVGFSPLDDALFLLLWRVHIRSEVMKRG